MKKNVFSIMAKYATSVTIALTIVACNTNPDESVDETKNKLHEDPARMELVLTEVNSAQSWEELSKTGKLVTSNTNANNEKQNTQTISYETQIGKGWVISPNSASKFVVSSTKQSTVDNKLLTVPVYTLAIKYYNNKGELMNYQFLTNGQDAIHQHFFQLPKNNPVIVNGKEDSTLKAENLIDYLYADTDFKDGSFIGSTNPIGLNGIIRFLVPKANYTLRVELFHGYIGKKDPRTQAFSPFYHPSPLMIQTGTWDVQVNIPIEVK